MRKQCDCIPLISPFMDGELSGDKAARVRSHLETCEDCRKELESFQIVDNLLQGIREIDPSEGFERSFWRKAADSEEKKTRRSFSGFLFSGWRPYLATALTALLVAGFFFLRDRSSPGQGSEEILIAEQLELFVDFELINQLDLLENWDAIMTLEEKS
jgi:hypothetical protein